LKLNADREERAQGVWDNMLLTSSNNSLVEYLEEISKNDGAALVRCFEFDVPKILAGDEAYGEPARIASIIASLDHNHGHAGREYARILGSDPEGLQQMYDAVCARFTLRIEPYQPHERFWMAAAATIIMGGMLANELPILKMNMIRFDLDALTEFLVQTYMHLRNRLANAHVHADMASFSKYYLGQFLNTWAAPRNEVVWTLEAPNRPGKPAASAPIWPLGDEARRMKQVSVRWITTERKLKISKSSLDKFLRQEKVSTDRMKEGLTSFYDARLNQRGRMAGGLTNIAAQGLEAVYEIDVKKGTWLDDILQLHAIDEAAKKIEPPPREQSQHPQEPHHQPEQKGPADATNAS
jgi:hypothetical protein